MNTATGQSIADAVNQNQQDLLDREVHGGGGKEEGGAKQGGVGAAGGVLGLGAFSSGRLRMSDHDGLDKEYTDPFNPAAPNKTYDYDTDEASAFVNVVATMPERVLGGHLKASGLVGYNWLSLDVKSNGASVLDPGQSGSASNDSVIAGGSLLWANTEGTYVLGTLIGTLGQTRLSDGIDDCFNGTCNLNRYRFNTIGFNGSVTAGHVFDLPGASGAKLDVRGALGYVRNHGSKFINVHGDEQQYEFSTWTGTGSLTLFSNMTLASKALLRPYIQAYVRQEWDYRNEFDAVEFQSFAFLGQFDHDRSHTYGGLDGGVTYAVDNLTLGGALYFEASADERTFGGRLGASWKLDEGAGQGALAPGRSNWAGPYVGVSGGYTWGNTDAAAKTSCALVNINNPPPEADDPLAGYFCNRISDAGALPVTSAADLARAATVTRTGSGPLDPDGFTGGAQIGRNWQTANLVVGVEVDGSTFNLSDSRSATATTPGDAYSHTVSSSIDTDWLLTARLRLGWAVSSALIYATAGLAVTEIDVAASYRDTNGPGGTMDSSHSDVRAGIAFGGGLEWALDKHWSVKGEYLYVDFGSVTTFGPVGNPGFPTLLSPYSVTTDLTTQTARVGTNYKF